MLSFVGAGIMAIAFALIVYNVYYSIRYSPRNISADPWDARSLEWATHTPVPEYNFAIIPQVDFRCKHSGMLRKKDMNYSQVNIEEIHMPNNSGVPFIYELYLLCMGILICICIWPLADYCNNRNLCLSWLTVHLKKIMDDHISVKEIEETEKKLRGAN